MTRDWYLYLRKSRGVAGISRQRTVTTTYVEKTGGRVAGEFSDADKTAYHAPGTPRPDRPGFTALLAAVAAHPGAGIAAWHADRLIRSGGDAEDMIAVCAAGGHPVTTPRGGDYQLWTAIGRRRLRDDATVAAYEVDHLTERITEQKLEYAVAGEWPGGFRPFGWRLIPAGPETRRRYDGLAVNEEEAAEIREAARLILGGASQHAVCRDLNDRGITTSRGSQWTPRSLRRMLLRPWNAGLAVHQGSETGTAAVFPAILGAETFRAIEQRLTAKMPGTNVRVWPGSGLYLCGAPGEDGEGYCGVPLKARHAHRHVVYLHHGHVARSAVPLDEYVTTLIGLFLDQDGAAEKIDAMRPRPLREDVTALHSRIAALREGALALARLRATGDIDDAQLAAGSAEARAEMRALEKRVAAAAGVSPLDVLAGPSPREKWERLLKSGDIGQVQAVIRALMTVRVLPTGRGRPKGSPSRERFFKRDAVKIEWHVPPMPPGG
jgi:site-specific DNA recombinase